MYGPSGVLPGRRSHGGVECDSQGPAWSLMINPGTPPIIALSVTVGMRSDGEALPPPSPLADCLSSEVGDLGWCGIIGSQVVPTYR